MPNFVPKFTMIIASFLVASSLSSHADIRVTYTDSSPTDHFTVQNVSGCMLYKGELTIDFSTSLGQLVFDIDRNGWAGHEFSTNSRVHQPLTIVGGEAFVKNVTDVKDGDNKVTIEFVNFKHGDRIHFNVDVDDTSGAYHPSVSGLEIQGASLNVITPTTENDGAFDANAVAETDRTSCIS